MPSLRSGPSAAPRARLGGELDRRGLGLLAAAHLSTDLCQAAVPALLPFFVD
jgi:hypothetical protein